MKPCGDAADETREAGQRAGRGARGSRGAPWRRRGRRGRRLETRLFLWFLGAIVFALLSAIGTIALLNIGDPSMGPARLASRSIAANVARRWDDPAAVDAYLAHVHDVVGLDLHVRRDADTLPIRVRRAGKRGEIVFEGTDAVLIPVVRNGEVLGAVEMAGSSGVPRRPHWIVPLLAALLFLGLGARIVSRRIARPLESVAHAATRFGEGDLASRTGLGDRPRRWVAEEVRDVARAFDTMAGRIEGVVREQRELLGAISHELRSPIGRARVALEIARDRSAPAPAPQLDEIERQLVDVDAILGDLLAAARAGLADLHAQPTPLLEWLRKRIAAEPMPPAIELRTDVAELQVLLEPALMNRALHNLLANARAHGHPAAVPLEVRVEVDEEGGAKRVRVIVRDRGPGFAPDMLAHARAFEPFVKGDAARTPGAGSGLGLALVRRIVEAHGGRAFARNAADATPLTGGSEGDVDGGGRERDSGGGGGGGGGAEVGFELPLDRSRGA